MSLKRSNLIWPFFATLDIKTCYDEVANQSGVEFLRRDPHWNVPHLRFREFTVVVFQGRKSALARLDHNLRVPPSRPRSAVSRLAILSAGILLLHGPKALAAEGIYRDAHEGPETSWHDAGGDAQHQIEGPKRLQGQGHAGEWAEFLRLNAGAGTSVYVSHDIPPAPIISELNASLWIKSDRAGLQLLARVVLPRTEDPRTGKPLTVLLRGSSYAQVGAWQQLKLDDLPNQLTRYSHALRSELKHDADTREAYLDRIVLNAFGGQGQTNVWIDDLEVNGCVARTTDPEVKPAQFTGPAPVSATATKPPDIKQQGTTLVIDGRPFFPRGIEYRGEPLSQLQRLGFNTVFLTFAPPPDLCREAANLDMWIVGPPPPIAGDRGGEPPAVPAELGPEYDRVLAWDLGQGLSNKDLDATILLTKQIRAADRRVNRLLICGADSDLRAFSRQADVLLTKRLPLGTSLELADYAVWLRERPRLARPGTPTWTVIQTQLPPNVQEQQTLLSHGRVLKPVAEEESIRLLTRVALSSGVRGICFQSNSRLDGSDAETRMRAISVALVNLELDLLEPWAAGGTFVTTASSNSSEITGAVLQTERAKLLLPMRISQGAQCVPRPDTLTGLKFIIPGVPETNQVFELTPAGMRTLTHKRVAGGISVELGETGVTGLIVMTQDPLVVNSLTRRATILARTAAEWQRELAAASLVLTEALDNRLTGQGHGVREAAGWLSTAKANLQQADAALTAGDAATAFLKGRQATNTLLLLKRDQWEQAAGLPKAAPDAAKTSNAPNAKPHDSLAKPAAAVASTATPFSATFNTLPQHWEFREEIRVARPLDNRLAGGDFEDLNAMVRAGWQHFQFAQPEVKTEVELSPQGAAAGRFGLHIRAVAANAQAVPPLLESIPVWVTSPPVNIEAGTMIAIAGKVKINSPIVGSVDGLMVFDSIGGEALSERIGETKGWKDFVLYRVVPTSGPITVSFALTGLGDVYIDEVTIRPLQRGGVMPGGPVPGVASPGVAAPSVTSPLGLPPGTQPTLPPPGTPQAFGLPPTLR